MATVNRSDVELVLRARDEVSKTLGEMRKQLDGLVADSQRGVSAFAGLDKESERLRGTLAGLSDAERDLIGKGRLIEQFRKEEQALSRLNEKFRQSAIEVRRLKDTQANLAIGESRGTPLGKSAADGMNVPIEKAQRAAARANQAFRELRERLGETTQAMRAQGIASNDLAGAEARLVAEAGRLRAAQDRVGASLAGMAARGGGASAMLRNLGEDSRRSLSITQRLRGEIVGLAASYVGLLGVGRQVGQVFEDARRLAGIESGLRVAFDGDPTKVQQQLDFLRETSNRLQVSFLDLGKSYSQFLAAVPEGTFSLEEVQRIFIGVATAGKVMRLSTDEMQGTFRAIIQIVSKGNVQMEELRGQLGDRLPGALILFAKANGVAIAELEKLVEQRQITSRSLIPFADELEQRFGKDLAKALAAPTASLEQFQVAMERLHLDIGQDSDLISGIAAALREVAAELANPEFRDGLKSLADGIGQVIRFSASAVKNINAIATTLGVAFGGRFLVGIAAAIVKFAQLRKEIGLLAAVIGAGTGPVGWLVVVATLLLSWKSSADEAVPSIKELREEVDALRRARDGLGKAPDDIAVGLPKSSLDKQIDASEKRIKEFQAALNRPFAGFAMVDFSAALDDEFKRLDLLVDKQQLLARQRLPAPRVPDKTGVGKGAPGADVSAADSGKSVFDGLADAIKKANEAIAALNADTLAKKLALITEKYREQAEAAKKTAGTADDALVQQAIGAEQKLLRLETEKKLQEELQKLSEDAAKQGDTGLTGKLAEIRAEFQKTIDAAQELGRTDLAAAASSLLDKRLTGEISGVKDELRKELLDIRAEDSADLDARLEIIREKYRATIEALNAVDKEGANLAERVLAERIALATKAAAGEQVQKAEGEINQLLELRSAIIDRITNQQQLGMLTAQQARDQTRAELADLDPRIQRLIDQARELVDVQLADGLLSADDANLLKERLNNMALGLRDLKTEAAVFAQSFRESFASGLTSAISDFVRGVSSAREAITAFFADFLQQIGEAILKQVILNALMSATGGAGGVFGFLGGVAAGTHHTGGIAGVGPANRTVSPLAFLAAPRYHGGGIVGTGLGIRNGEVPSILKRGEEVLTENDPRHVRNGGKQSGGNTRILNFVDKEELMRAVMNTPAGDKFVINAVMRNRGALGLK